jgi:SAM-dependent methyltransferase
VLAQATHFANDPDYLKVCPFISSSFAFICGYAEALPLAPEQFDFAHMRSMLDHASSPRLALAEAHRVLRPGGRVIIGLAVSGSPTGSPALQPGVRGLLGMARLKYHLSGPKGLAHAAVRRLKSGEFFHDPHMWHPSASELREMVVSVGFSLESEHWQAPPFDHVLFLVAAKRLNAHVDSATSME